MKRMRQTELKHLEDKHQRLAREVDRLMSRMHLTPGEYQRAMELKKRKLMLKDDITALRHGLAR